MTRQGKVKKSFCLKARDRASGNDGSPDVMTISPTYLSFKKHFTNSLKKLQT